MIPKIKLALNGWVQPITLIKLTESMTDYDVLVTESPIVTDGVVQQHKPTQVQIKKEGGRAWKWLSIHTKSEIGLQELDKIKYLDTKYIVREISDFKCYGYYNYIISEDYE